MSRQDDARLDDVLAAFTDDLMAGYETSPPSEIDDLARVVRDLHRVIEPGRGASPVFRARLNQRLQREWTLQHERRRLTLWRDRPQLMVAAAGVAVVILAVVFVLAQGGGDDQSIEGTALGSPVPIVLVAIGVAAIGLAVLWYRRRE